MCEEEYNEGNKLIAEFMGLEKNDFGYWVNKDYLFGAQLKLFDFELKFHSSWDWLMPVVEKIEKDMDMWIRIERDYIFVCRFNDYSGIISSSNTFTHNKGKIYGVWLAVVEFIKWYNSCQKEK